MRSIDKIIIHCAATPNGRIHTAADIDAWHKAQGWTKIGYHFVICVDGSVEEGRMVSEVGSHAKGFNASSVSICLIGTDKFTPAQWHSLKTLVSWLKDQFPAAAVMGHRDLPEVKKSCPGFDVRSWWADGGIPDDKHILTGLPATSNT